MPTPKEYIESIFAETGKSSRDAKNLTNSLNSLTADLYTETERFIFELLQNADDLPNKNKNVQVKFIFLNKHLLILHNGQPFQENNVNAICKISDSTKSKDANQTGYKGIGFKSVFTESKCVYINSGNFSFKFDRDDDRHQSVDTPWQIKPIWVEKDEYPSEIYNCYDFFEEPVATALEITENKISEYQEKIQNLFNDTRLILFLRNVSTVEVYGLNESYISEANPSFKIEKIKNEDTCIIRQNDNDTEWLVKEYKFDIESSVKDAIDNDKKVPDKLKNINRTELTFAVQIKHNEIVKADDSVLFSYLPTNVKEYNFPFLVNANFLTTANRQSIHVDNAWNQFLFRKIGINIFNFIKYLANHNKYKKFITAILPKQFNRISDPLEREFNIGFDEGINNTSFIPPNISDNPNDNLLKACEALIDETQLTTKVNNKEFQNYIVSFLYNNNLLDKKSRYFVNNSLKNMNKIKKLPSVKVFNSEHLSQFIANDETIRQVIQNKPESNLFLLQHIYEENLDSRLFDNISFILDEQESLQAPKNLYFQIQPEDKEELIFTELKFLHPTLNERILQDEDFKEWVQKDLGIKVFSGEKLIKSRIKNNNFQPDVEINLEVLVAYVKFIFKYRRFFNQEQLYKLRNLYLVYKDIQTEKLYMELAENCHLSDFYLSQEQEPVAPIANYINSNYFKFIIEDYCDSLDEKAKWREFFTSIGVVNPDFKSILETVIKPIINNNQVNEENSLYITRFLFVNSKNTTLNDDEIEQLKHIPLKTNSGWIEAYQCYILENELWEHNEFNIQLKNIVDLQNYVNVSELKAFRRFLINNLSVNFLNYNDIISKKIHKISENPELVTAENTINIVREFYYNSSHLTEQDYNKLSKLNLLLKNNNYIRQANLCYLSNDYNPIKNMESLYSATDFNGFVSPKYCQGEENYEEWKQFFIKIGVIEDFSFLQIKDKRSLDNLNIPLLADYKRFLYNQHNQAKYIENFVVIKNIINYIPNNTKLAKALIEYLDKNWSNLNINLASKLLHQSNKVLKDDVPTYVEFYLKHYPCIPCRDKNCHAPNQSKGIYTYQFRNIIEDCFPVAWKSLNSNLEKFLGIKNYLEISDYLAIIDDISTKYNDSPQEQVKRLEETLKQLVKDIQNNQIEVDQGLIQDWKSNYGKLLAYNNQFKSVKELFYLEPSLELPPKNNPYLLFIPSSLLYEEYQINIILDLFGIPRITNQDLEIQTGYKEEDHDFRELILQRSIFIEVFLRQYLFNQLETSIRNRIDQFNFYKTNKIVITCPKINYKESIFNYYNKQERALYYVRHWNTIKNANIADYLIDILDLDKQKISSQVLLRLLDDTREEVKEYLKENGYNISQIENSTADPEKKHYLEDIKPKTDESITTDDEGTGIDPEEWGKWGEKQAKEFYEKNGFAVQKIQDYLRVGYDFECTKGSFTKYVEVKTITSETPIIRLKESQWKRMQFPIKEKSFVYELLIIAHTGNSLDYIIQITNLWKILKKGIGSLDFQTKTEAKYQSGNIEIVIGLQENSNQQENEFLINWHRLFLMKKHPNISVHNYSK